MRNVYEKTIESISKTIDYNNHKVNSSRNQQSLKFSDAYTDLTSYYLTDYVLMGGQTKTIAYDNGIFYCTTTDKNNTMAIPLNNVQNIVGIKFDLKMTGYDGLWDETIAEFITIENNTGVRVGLVLSAKEPSGEDIPRDNSINQNDDDYHSYIKLFSEPIVKADYLNLGIANRPTYYKNIKILTL